MSSIVLNWIEINTYGSTIGPKFGRPSRPACCPVCDAVRIWFDGWRRVYAVVLADGTAHRFDDGLWVQRVVCSQCRVSWGLRPPFLYPHRVYQPDVNEAASLAYLSDPGATYNGVGTLVGCSPRSVWRWTGWLAALITPATLIAAIALIDPSASILVADAMPRDVPQDHAKARSKSRTSVLLVARQTLAGLSAFARVQVHPPDDPSALRFWLTARFLTFRERALVTRFGLSPQWPEEVRGPSG